MSHTLDDIQLGGRFKALFVGPSGGGKTVAAASILQLADSLVTSGQLKIEQAKTYLFDLDGRYRPIRKMYPQLVGKGLLEFDHFGDKDFDLVINKVNKLSSDFEKNPRAFFAVIFDGLTTLGLSTMQYAMDNRPTVTKEENVNVGKLRMPQLQDYKGEQRGIGYVIGALKELPCHFIMTAHEVSYDIKNTKGEVIGQERVLVTQGKKAAPQVPIFFDEMYYFKPEVMAPGDPAKYYAYTVPLPEWPARTALNGLPGKIESTIAPGQAGLFPKILGYVDKWNLEHPDQKNEVMR